MAISIWDEQVFQCYRRCRIVHVSPFLNLWISPTWITLMAGLERDLIKSQRSVLSKPSLYFSFSTTSLSSVSVRSILILLCSVRYLTACWSRFQRIMMSAWVFFFGGEVGLFEYSKLPCWCVWRWTMHVVWLAMMPNIHIYCPASRYGACPCLEETLNAQGHPGTKKFETKLFLVISFQDFLSCLKFLLVSSLRARSTMMFGIGDPIIPAILWIEL